jgi:tryptophan synthase alpha chain
VVVGSALVDALRGTLDQNGKPNGQTVAAVTALVSDIAGGMRSVRKTPV